MTVPHHILTESHLYRHVAQALFTPLDKAAGDRVGMELELFPMRRNVPSGNYCPVPLFPLNGDIALLPMLEAMAQENEWELVNNEFGALTVLVPGKGQITLEPAGQVEYSSLPHVSVQVAFADLEWFVQKLEEKGRDAGIEFLAGGYNSWCAPEQHLLQVSKPRYQAMDEHFQEVGPFGRMMMRATCALQISLDFGKEEDISSRWRLANMISPSLNAIFANSPHEYEGKQYRSFRYEIWNHTDPCRTGRLFDCPDLDPVADYLRFALDATVMLIRRDGDSFARPETRMPFREWMKGDETHGFPDIKDWELHLTTLFPDVRPRGFMEIRSVDCLPREWRSVPVSMLVTLMYDARLRDAALELLEERERLITPGEYEHQGYWTADFTTGKEMLELALGAMKPSPLAETARRYYETYTGNDLTPADAKTVAV